MREIRIPGLRRVLRVSWSDDALRREVDEEIRFHIEARVDELVQGGASEREARERAETEYGDVRGSRSELAAIDRRRMGQEKRGEVLMSLAEDLKYAARGLMRRPALLTITTLALSIGIAANAIMFGVVDQLLLRPPPHVTAPETLRRIYFRNHGPDGSISHGPVTTHRVIAALAENVPGVDVVSFSHVNSYSLGSGARARPIDVQMVSGNYFSVLGVRVAHGRPLLPGDDRTPRGDAVVVVSDRFWSRELGAEPDAVGRTIRIQGRPFVIVGIAPKGFSGLDRRRTDAWLPISALADIVTAKLWYSEPHSWWLESVARVQDVGSDVEAANAATLAYRNEVRTWKRSQDTTAQIVLGPIIGTRTPDGMSQDSKVSLWLMGVSAIVLIIACANVANLLIARTFQRRREIAVRLALGVSRMRLLQLLLTESALLAAISAGLALLLAIGASRVVQNVLLAGIVWSENVIDARILLFTMAVTVVCILLAGLAPALQGMGTRVSESLKAASAHITGRSRLRQTLLVIQATLSVVLLIGAGLFVRSLNHVVSRDVGIDLDQVLLVHMDLDGLGFTRARSQEIFIRAHERVLLVPGVASASLVRQTVPSRSGSGMSIRLPGVEKRPELSGGGPYGGVVGAEYFATMGTALLRGRAFTPGEERVSNRALIINKMVADAFWPGRDPVGQCARLGSDSTCSTVVGVVENQMLFGLVRDDRALIYVAPGHASFGDKPVEAMVVRATGQASELISLIRKEVQALGPDIPFVQVEPYTQRVARQLRPWRLGATMFSMFGVIALVIAAVGLYSVMAYWVAQRTHEIGVRMALGARRTDVVRLVAWQSSRAVIAGVVLGMSAAALASRWITDLLYETSATDPLIYTAAGLALVVAALLASVIPARRSAAVDPAQAIRHE